MHLSEHVKIFLPCQNFSLDKRRGKEHSGPCDQSELKVRIRLSLLRFQVVKTHCVESVVDDVLQVFAHSDLLHQLVLVAVHSSQLAHVGEDVLQAVGKLEGVHVVESVLQVAIVNIKYFSFELRRTLIT